MAKEPLEKRFGKAIIRIDRNVEEIKDILNHMVETRKYYLTDNGYCKNNEYD